MRWIQLQHDPMIWIPLENGGIISVPMSLSMTDTLSVLDSTFVRATYVTTAVEECTEYRLSPEEIKREIIEEHIEYRH